MEGEKRVLLFSPSVHLTVMILIFNILLFGRWIKSIKPSPQSIGTVYNKNCANTYICFDEKIIVIRGHSLVCNST
jgi:hypothetical protein